MYEIAHDRIYFITLTKASRVYYHAEYTIVWLFFNFAITEERMEGYGNLAAYHRGSDLGIDEELERQVNSWLKGRQIDIVNVQQSQSMRSGFSEDTSDMVAAIFTMLYRETF